MLVSGCMLSRGIDGRGCGTSESRLSLLSAGGRRYSWLNRIDLLRAAAYNRTGIETSPKVRYPFHTMLAMGILNPKRFDAGLGCAARDRTRTCVKRSAEWSAQAGDSRIPTLTGIQCKFFLLTRLRWVHAAPWTQALALVLAHKRALVREGIICPASDSSEHWGDRSQ